MCFKCLLRCLQPDLLGAEDINVGSVYTMVAYIRDSYKLDTSIRNTCVKSVLFYQRCLCQGHIYQKYLYP